ncbi:hypothetical protein pdam_00004032 [Pocillopora damicornis]|uniref:Uncharacterized protein n=1 Tax=Pocillopora damicornis TaxID=46731 RepID=A0A3M6TDW0_POCDA|nr:hypothetical protein pdam_00004032 [Pocillopora damicornis]
MAFSVSRATIRSSRACKHDCVGSCMKWKRFLPSTNFPTSAHDPSAVDPLAQAFYFHGSCSPSALVQSESHFCRKDTQTSASNAL